MPIEFGKAQWESRRKRFEDAWEYVLIVGLGLELISLPMHISGAARLNKQTEEFRSTNLVLRAKVVELENNITQTSNNVVKIDPREQPIKTATAFVRFVAANEGDLQRFEGGKFEPSLLFSRRGAPINQSSFSAGVKLK